MGDGSGGSSFSRLCSAAASKFISKPEAKKKTDLSIVSLRLTAAHYPKPRNYGGGRTLYARRKSLSLLPLPDTLQLEGQPVTPDIMVNFREILFGMSPIRFEWMNVGFSFQVPESDFAYGLVTHKIFTRPLSICVGGHVLKHLLFHENDSTIPVETLLRPDATKQMVALVRALADILWQAGEKRTVYVCLPKTKKLNEFITSPRVIKNEQLLYFTFDDLNNLVEFLKRHYSTFCSEKENGCLLFLYSVILTRGYERLKEEMSEDVEQLLTPTGGATIAFINLMLTGKATPFVHNGVMYLESEEPGKRKILSGVATRSEVGFLIWNTNNDTLEKQLGSRLKTPLFPIWITCSDGQYGILFNPNKELIRNYRAERRFDLHYYSSTYMQTQPCILSVDTRRPKVVDDTRFFIPHLEKIILTKWHGAEINWNGITPYL